MQGYRTKCLNSHQTCEHAFARAIKLATKSATIVEKIRQAKYLCHEIKSTEKNRYLKTFCDARSFTYKFFSF